MVPDAAWPIAETTREPAAGFSSTSTIIRSGEMRMPRVHSGTGAPPSKA